MRMSEPPPRSAGKLREAEADFLPLWVSPMLARSSGRILVELTEWAIEPKWDGWRCLARIHGDSVRLASRWCNDVTTRFPDLGIPGRARGKARATRRQARRAAPGRLSGFPRAHGPATIERRGSPSCASTRCTSMDAPHPRAYAVRRRALEQLRLKQGHWLTMASLRGDAGAALYGFTLERGWEGICRGSSGAGEGLRSGLSALKRLSSSSQQWPSQCARAVL